MFQSLIGGFSNTYQIELKNVSTKQAMRNPKEDSNDTEKIWSYLKPHRNIICYKSPIVVISPINLFFTTFACLTQSLIKSIRKNMKFYFSPIEKIARKS
jgi:hypothetical protein